MDTCNTRHPCRGYDALGTSCQYFGPSTFYSRQHARPEGVSAMEFAIFEDADPSIGLNAARALMLRGDASGMGVIKTVFLPGPQALPDRLEETVSNAISIGIHDPQLIPDLEHLLNSSSRYMRKGVTIALMRTESPNALNALRRALADSDVEVRYYGLLGLGRITGDGEMLPSMERFKADEA